MSNKIYKCRHCGCEIISEDLIANMEIICPNCGKKISTRTGLFGVRLFGKGASQDWKKIGPKIASGLILTTFTVISIITAYRNEGGVILIGRHRVYIEKPDVTIEPIKIDTTAVGHELFEFVRESVIEEAKKQGLTLESEESFSWAVISCDPDVVEVVIPEMVSTIKSGAFKNCSKLEKLTISNSVKSIEKNALPICKTIIIAPGNNTFMNGDAGEVIDLKNKALIWFPPDFSGEYTIPNGVVSIGSTLRNCSGITTVIVPGDIKKIEHTSFPEKCKVIYKQKPVSARKAESAKNNSDI